MILSARPTIIIHQINKKIAATQCPPIIRAPTAGIHTIAVPIYGTGESNAAIAPQKATLPIHVIAKPRPTRSPCNIAAPNIP